MFAFIRDEIAFILNDERIVYIPLSWSKKLQKANPANAGILKTTASMFFGMI